MTFSRGLRISSRRHWLTVVVTVRTGAWAADLVSASATDITCRLAVQLLNDHSCNAPASTSARSGAIPRRLRLLADSLPSTLISIDSAL